MVNSGLYGVSSGTLTDNSNCSVLINTTLSNKLFCTYTVQGLPMTANTGAMAFVSNATACTQNNAPVAGGSTFCGVVWNGSAWVSY
jgi:trimethylamine:corrinoid methyltransferase-like protein